MKIKTSRFVFAFHFALVCLPGRVYPFLVRRLLHHHHHHHHCLTKIVTPIMMINGREGTAEEDTSTTTNNDTRKQRIRILGVCGGIGSGKSTVCQVLVSEFGCLGHIEADRLAHDVYKPNSPVLKELAATFGSNLIQQDGNLNRGELGKVVFGNPRALQKLEHLVWPHVQALVQTRIQELKDSYVSSKQDKIPIIIVEAAVLLDAGWNEFHDGVWVVKVSPEVALARLQRHRNMAHDEALQRIEAQKLRRGMGNLQEEIDKGVVSAVIDNSGDVDALKGILSEKLRDEMAWYAKK